MVWQSVQPRWNYRKTLARKLLFWKITMRWGREGGKNGQGWLQMVRYLTGTSPMRNTTSSAPTVMQTTSKHLQIKRKTVFLLRRQLNFRELGEWERLVIHLVVGGFHQAAASTQLFFAALQRRHLLRLNLHSVQPFYLHPKKRSLRTLPTILRPQRV